jgi:hypothetical protein
VLLLPVDGQDSYLLCRRLHRHLLPRVFTDIFIVASVSTAISFFANASSLHRRRLHRHHLPWSLHLFSSVFFAIVFVLFESAAQLGL